MTYWWNEIGDRISLFNLADICPKAWLGRIHGQAGIGRGAQGAFT